jgi:DNA-binding CsgD family transcriptional regulator
MAASHSTVSPILVGRVGELGFLNDALHAASGGAGYCVLLSGEAGIGKSRLLGEVRKHAMGQDFVVLQGRCFEQDGAFPYSLWINALRDFFAWCSPSQIEGLLGPLASVFVKLLPELSSLLPGIQPPLTLDPESDKRRLFEGLARFAARLSETNPLLIALEDLHWSDEASLDSLHFFSQRISRRPILLIATYRSDEATPQLTHFLAQIKRERVADELDLVPLTRVQVAEMIHAILRTEWRPEDDLLNPIMELTEGNPFFVEEILRGLIEAGDIFYREGQSEPRSSNELHVPLTVQESVQRRVQRLPESRRRILALAAVIGERFDFRLLQEIADEDEQSLLLMLKELIAAQLIVEESADQFAFRHAITREVVYGTLMARERRALHQQIALVLEQLPVSAHLQDLAYHYDKGEVWDKALAYSERAAEYAERLYALPEAVTHLSRAIELSDKLALPALELLHRRSQVYELLSNYEQASADSERALDTARTLSDARGEWQALLDLGFVAEAISYQQAGEFFQPALALARRFNDPARLGSTLNHVGTWLLNVDRPGEAGEYLAEALGIFEELQDLRGVAQSLELLGMSAYGASDAIRGKAFSERAMGLFSQLNDPRGLLQSTLHAMLPGTSETEVTDPLDLGLVSREAENLRQMARGLGWRAGELTAEIIMAWVLAMHGEYARALAAAEHGYAFAIESGHRTGLPVVTRILGYIYHDLLAPDRAQPYLEDGLSAAREGKAMMQVHGSTATLASVYVSQGRLAQAASLLDAVLGEGFPTRVSQIRHCWAARAELALASGEPMLALHIADELIATAPNIDTHGSHSIPKLSLLRAEALAALGRPAEAESGLRPAADVAHAQARLPLLWRIHLELADLYHLLKRDADASQELALARSVVTTLADNVTDEALRTDFLQQALTLIEARSRPSRRRTALPAFGGLTAREREVAGLVAQGKSNRAIADELIISEKTAERHVANIMSKLGFNSRAQIAVWAVEKGLDRGTP